MKGRQVSKLRGHIIVCGYGRNGRRAALELKNSRKKFLIIERDDHVLERFPDAAKTFNFFMGEECGFTTAKILLATTELPNPTLISLPSIL